MNKKNLLSASEMKKILGGNDPGDELMDPSADLSVEGVSKRAKCCWTHNMNNCGNCVSVGPGAYCPQSGATLVSC